jgi:hypothetical protein
MVQNNVKTEGLKREVKEEREKERLAYISEYISWKKYKLSVFIFYMLALPRFCMTQCRLTSIQIQKIKPNLLDNS